MLASQKSSPPRRRDQHVLIGPAALGSAEFAFQNSQRLFAKTLPRLCSLRPTARQQLGVQQAHRHYRQHRNERLQSTGSLQLTVLHTGPALEGLMILFDPPPRRVRSEEHTSELQSPMYL